MFQTLTDASIQQSQRVENKIVLTAYEGKQSLRVTSIYQRVFLSKYVSLSLSQQENN